MNQIISSIIFHSLLFNMFKGKCRTKSNFGHEGLWKFRCGSMLWHICFSLTFVYTPIRKTMKCLAPHWTHLRRTFENGSLLHWTNKMKGKERRVVSPGTALFSWFLVYLFLISIGFPILPQVKLPEMFLGQTVLLLPVFLNAGRESSGSA